MANAADSQIHQTLPARLPWYDIASCGSYLQYNHVHLHCRYIAILYIDTNSTHSFMAVQVVPLPIASHDHNHNHMCVITNICMHVCYTYIHV